MKRRNFIIGVGATSVGSAGAIGTGAVSSITADRDVNLRIAADSNAYLKFEDSSAVATTSNDQDVLVVDLREINSFPQVEGEGFNRRSVYELDDVKAGESLNRSGEIFQIWNQSDRKIEFAAKTVDEKGPTIELYDVSGGSRTAIDEDNPHELGVGDPVGIGLRIIVPEDAELGEHSQTVRVTAEDATE